MKIKIEILMSVTAMVTAVAAVVVAIVQTQVMHDEAMMEREHARLSVLPSIEVYTHNHTAEGEGKFRIGLVNQGIGPAVIEGFTISLDKKPIHSWSAFVHEGTEGAVSIAGPDRNVGTVIQTEIDPGLFLPVGERLAPLQLEGGEEVGTLLRSLGERLDIKVCYCSLYKECWVSGLQEARPEPVNSCSAYKDRFFRNEE